MNYWDGDDWRLLSFPNLKKLLGMKKHLQFWQKNPKTQPYPCMLCTLKASEWSVFCFIATAGEQAGTAPYLVHDQWKDKDKYFKRLLNSFSLMLTNTTFNHQVNMYFEPC